MKKLSLLFIAVLLFSVLVSSWAQEQTAKELKFNPDKFVFIEHHIHTHGEFIEGNCPKLMIDSAMYNFDKETGVLEGVINFDINKNLQAIYGDGSSLSGDTGGGWGTGLSGIYEFPFEQRGVKILEVEVDGTVHLEYNKIPILLKSNEEWINTTSEIKSWKYEDKICKANFTKTDKIINHGILDKSKIKSWK